MASLSTNEIKMKQYVLIAKAGLAVTAMKEKNISLLEDSIFLKFTAAVTACQSPQSFDGFIKSHFLRRKSFKTSLEKLDSGDLHSGGSLWRKFKEIKIVLMNDFAPVLSKKLPGGQLPSGRAWQRYLLPFERKFLTIMKLNRRKNRKLLKVIRDIDLWRAGFQSSGMYLPPMVLLLQILKNVSVQGKLL